MTKVIEARNENVPEQSGQRHVRCVFRKTACDGAERGEIYMLVADADVQLLLMAPALSRTKAEYFHAFSGAVATLSARFPQGLIITGGRDAVCEGGLFPNVSVFPGEPLEYRLVDQIVGASCLGDEEGQKRLEEGFAEILKSLPPVAAPEAASTEAVEEDQGFSFMDRVEEITRPRRIAPLRPAQAAETETPGPADLPQDRAGAEDRIVRDASENKVAETSGEKRAVPLTFDELERAASANFAKAERLSPRISEAKRQDPEPPKPVPNPPAPDPVVEAPAKPTSLELVVQDRPYTIIARMPLSNWIGMSSEVMERTADVFPFPKFGMTVEKCEGGRKMASIEISPIIRPEAKQIMSAMFDLFPFGERGSDAGILIRMVETGGDQERS